MNKNLFYCICVASVFFSVLYYYFTNFSGIASKVNTVTNNSTFEKNVTQEKCHFVILSTFYYKKSKLYSPNSIIILINGRRGAETINFQCHSKNKTEKLISEAQIREAEPGPYCKWISYIINCTTVIDPSYFGLSMSNNSKAEVEIKFENPVREKYPVIMCYPPMVYESRWQQIIFATEIYHYFGADLQIQYINSAMKEIVDILEIYEKKRWIKIQKFAYIDFNSTILAEIGYRPMWELDSRNQPIAYTDCMMRYRESSEFMIVADVDDVLIPQKTNYYKEFSHWAKIYPFAAAFMYFRVAGGINAPNSFGNFSLLNTIKSLNVRGGNSVGKSVYQPNKAESAWIHWPFFKNETVATIVPKYGGKMVHVGIGNSGESEKFKIMPQKQLNIISSMFINTFKDFLSFNSNFAYAAAISQCYGGSALWNSTNRPCLNPLQCPKPKSLKGFKCQVAKRKFSAAFLNESITFFIPNSDYFWDKSDNGCNVFAS